MAGQMVSITVNWNGSRFHCPACGAEVFDDEGCTQNPCPHLLFTWDSEAGAMGHCSTALSEEILRADEPDEEDRDDDREAPTPCDPEFVSLLEERDVVFCLEFSGMACGPCGFTVAVGIRFPDAE